MDFEGMGERKLAAMIDEAQAVVAFTGAGISTECGVPDFRSPDSAWKTYPPIPFDQFLADEAMRLEAWKRKFAMDDLYAGAKPGRGHAALARLVATGKVSHIITQNIDNLHQQAGNDPTKVFELHGNMRWIRCLDCGERHPLEEVLRRNRGSEELPVCGNCAGILKPDVIFFGEALPEETLQEATRRASRCDLLIVVGSSLVVYPAAYMPLYAKQMGAGLVIVNLGATSADNIADVVIHAAAGQTMGRILTEVKKRIAESCA